MLSASIAHMHAGESTRMRGWAAGPLAHLAFGGRRALAAAGLAKLFEQPLRLILAAGQEAVLQQELGGHLTAGALLVERRVEGGQRLRVGSDRVQLLRDRGVGAPGPA